MRLGQTISMLLLCWCAAAHAEDKQPLTARELMLQALEAQATLPAEPPHLPTVAELARQAAGPVGKAASARARAQREAGLKGQAAAQNAHLTRSIELSSGDAAHAAEESESVAHSAAGQQRAVEAKAKAKGAKDKGTGKGGNP